MFVSTRDLSFSYIGQTNSIITRLNQHNSGHGSSTTCPLSLRPFALFAYVCGFDNDTRLQLHFEDMWKTRRDSERRRGMICLKQIAKLASGITTQYMDTFNFDLRLILNFED